MNAALYASLIPARRPTPPPAHPWLEAGEVRRCRLRQAVRLQVVSGHAWVTAAGRPEDHFLRPGEGLDLGPGADLLVQAEGPDPLRWRWVVIHPDASPARR